jgi:hypothetical protein
MKIELKNIKHAAFASEETHCYSASLYVDGKKIGEVSNDGHGGCDRFHGDRAAFARAEAWVADNHPPAFEIDGEPVPMSMEILCGDLVNKWLLQQDLRKTLRGALLFTKPGTNGLFQAKARGGVKPQHYGEIRRRHPGAVVLNEMPFDQAFEIFEKAVA